MYIFYMLYSNPFIVFYTLLYTLISKRLQFTVKLILFIECEKNKTDFQGVILPVVISTSEILEKNINLLLNHCQHQDRAVYVT